MGRKLYVGNFPYETGEAELQELFARAGTVETVKVMRDMATGRARGFVFVEMTGTIRTLRVDKGFAFIKSEVGQDYFFHQTAIYGEGIADLREGDGVEFEVTDSPKGPRAVEVKRTTT